MATKLIIPKHEAERDEIEAVLGIFYEDGGWIDNTELVDRLKQKIGSGQYHSSYTKKVQIPAYFGFIEWQDITNNRSPKRITGSGRKFYEALLNNDIGEYQRLLIESLEVVSFGANNYGAPGSDSPIESPNVLIRASYDLHGVSIKEYVYALWRMSELGATYSSAISEILQIRNGTRQFEIGEEAKKWLDSKPITALKKFGLLETLQDSRIVVSQRVDTLYHSRLTMLPVVRYKLKDLFKQWLSEKGYEGSVDSYLRSIEALSMPLSQPMRKNTGSWEGLYEYVFGELPRVLAFDVSGAIDYLRSYGRLNVLLVRGGKSSHKVLPQKYQEVIDYTMLPNQSMDKGRLYNANEAYKKFLLWLFDNKHSYGMEYTEEELMIKKFLSAIRTKPFILLAGISGTGKSRLVRQLARGCCPDGHELGKNAEGNANSAKKPGNFEMIPVRPNWHDSTELMGYVTRLTDDNKPKYVIKPFVKFLVKAAIWKDVPFFLCLDEMNLAPVEQYFAEYLSVVETRKKNGDDIVSDVLVNFDQPEIDVEKTVQELMADWIDVTKDGSGKVVVSGKAEFPGAKAVYDAIVADKGVRIPKNFIVMGTVNMDETTCSFSRKVLDRAMTFELNEVDMGEGLKEDNSIPYGSIPVDQALATAVEGCDFYSANKDVCDLVKTYLEDVNEQLDNTPFKFAYRSRNEIMLYCIERCKDGIVDLAQALDEATSMKVLSRIEGDEQKLAYGGENADYKDKNLLQVLQEVIPAALKKVNEDAEPVNCSRCVKKLKFMERRLNSGFTNFFV